MDAAWVKAHAARRKQVAAFAGFGEIILAGKKA
jgi:hypothetical protein